MELKIVIEIDNEENQLGVILEGFPDWENDGIGSYEYWGYKSFDYGYDYAVMNDYPTWNQKLYTFEENWVIAVYLITNLERIDKLFCDMLEQETIPDY